jgi:hypothetical protein
MSFKYVLRFGGKNPELTEILHVWFDFLGFSPPIGKKNWKALGGTFTRETEEAVRKFQQRYNLVPPGKLGEVRANEWQRLAMQVGYKAWQPNLYACMSEGIGCFADTWNFLKNIGGHHGNTLSGGINVYGPKFLEMYAEEFGGISLNVIDGLGLFLNFMRTDKNLTDVRHAAYMMASVFKETAYTWQPIDEKGKGAGFKYGLVRTGKCGGKDYKNIYYGRGYIQITWEDNYQLADTELNLGCSLVANPERAKEPEIAYKIVSFGMKDGWFDPSKTNYKLSDFINGNTCDYLNARKIVNINDKKTYAEIEGYAKTFEAILRATMYR